MQLLRERSVLLAAARGAVVAIGNFDGLHLGHHAVLAETMRCARALSAPTAVLSFHPHPRRFFDPTRPPLALFPLREKIALLANAGMDYLFLRRFDAALAALTPHAFVEQVLNHALGAKHVVTGTQFLFGKARAGNAETLRSECARFGISTSAVTGVTLDGEPVSSSRIRACLCTGDVAEASALLGRPYTLSGRVVPGAARGREIGFPTANIRLPAQHLPAYGVYAVRVTLPDGTLRTGVANVGVRPTFGNHTPQLEVHVFDWNDSLYGARLTVELRAFLRPEQRFDSVDALRAQITRDAAEARAL